MGLLDNIFGKKAVEPDPLRVAPYFRTFTEYAPSFSTFSGGIYELELTRAAIHSFATGCSKLKPEIVGTAQPRIQRAIATSPNDYMTWPRFLYRLATILECDTTAYVVPAFDRNMNIVGLWPLKAEYAEIVDYSGVPWIRFHFANAEVSAIELENVCILSKYQYESDFFGTKNVLDATMKLIDAQNKAQEDAIKSGASIRFIGALQGQVREEDMEKKRERFSNTNLSAQNQSGIMLYDTTFANVEQIKPYNYTISAEEMNRIKENVYTYFGTNEDILQNHYQEDHWNAYYEGKIEPFAVQLGDGLSHLLYTQQERRRNAITFSSNRLQYATSASKRNMIRDMLDRGVMSINEARFILQMPPVPDGDVRVIRGEYIDATMLDSPTGDSDPEQHDETKKDSDLHGFMDVDEPDK